MNDNHKKDSDFKFWEKWKQNVGEKLSDPCLDEEILATYIDHKTTNQQNEIIEKHLSQCPKCLDELLSIKQLLKQRPQAIDNQIMEETIDFVMSNIPEQKETYIDLLDWLKTLNPLPNTKYQLASALTILLLISSLSLHIGWQTSTKLFDNTELLRKEISFGLTGVIEGTIF